MKINLTQEQLDTAIEILEYAQAHLEQEASALVGTARHAQDETLVRLSRKLGRQRLEQADRAADLLDLFLHQ